MRFLSRVVLLIPFSALFFFSCASLTAWIYGWGTWRAAVEMTAIITPLTTIWWIWPLFFRKDTSLVLTGAGVTILSALAAGLYLSSILFGTGPYGPTVTLFGKSATKLFTDDGGVVYALIVFPAIALLSGVFSSLMVWVATRRSGQD